MRRTKIYITNNTGERVPCKTKRIIKLAIHAAANEIAPGKSFEVSVLLVNNNEMRALNFQHRKLDKPTDVLSFPIDSEILGDIVISIEQAEIQAEKYGHSLRREIGFLTVHSMLHLFGFDHETPEDEAKMFDLQKKIMNKMRLIR